MTNYSLFEGSKTWLSNPGDIPNLQFAVVGFLAKNKWEIEQDGNNRQGHLNQ